MQKLIRNIRNNIKITPNELILKVNDKCSRCLGHKVIKSIYLTVHNKVRILFLNDKVLNFANFSKARDYLDITYNLKLINMEQEPEEIRQVVEKKDTSNITLVKEAIESMLLNFQNSSNKLSLNTIIMNDYFDSSTWKKNKFTKNELAEIVEYLYGSSEITSTRYINMAKTMIYKDYVN